MPSGLAGTAAPSASPRRSSPEPLAITAGADAHEDAAAAEAPIPEEKSDAVEAIASPAEGRHEPAPETTFRPGPILPLLGKPYFACIMCRSHVQQPFQVVVPRSLAPFLPSRTVPASVTSSQGRSWEMRFTGGRLIQRLEAGWRRFAVDSGLRVGDGCVFELVDGGGGERGVVFRVQVLRAEIPARIRERAGGCTSSSPIVIE